MRLTDLSYVFRRYEEKYLLTAEQYAAFFGAVRPRLCPDEFGKSTVMSVYLDTPSFRIIRASLDARDYKEKLRVRCYGQPRGDSTAFFELKKKFDGIVYKRRAAMTLEQAERFILTAEPPEASQIAEELAWSLRFYGMPRASMLICCEREAFFLDGEDDVRITFDTGVRYRRENADPRRGPDGKRLLPEGTVLAEIKTPGAMPLFLASELDRAGIRPVSFSKYGIAYRDFLALSDTNTIFPGGHFHV